EESIGWTSLRRGTKRSITSAQPLIHEANRGLRVITNSLSRFVRCVKASEISVDSGAKNTPTIGGDHGPSRLASPPAALGADPQPYFRPPRPLGRPRHPAAMVREGPRRIHLHGIQAPLLHGRPGIAHRGRPPHLDPEPDPGPDRRRVR